MIQPRYALRMEETSWLTSQCMMTDLPEIGLQPLKTQAQRASRMRGCYLAQKSLKALALKQLHKLLSLHVHGVIRSNCPTTVHDITI